MSAEERAVLVEQLVRELDDDLVFALSLGSKELFHTNLLGWFAQHQPSVGAALLREWDPHAEPALLRARREWRHLDLVLEEVAADGTPGQARVVVENKMFALPDLDQLRDYGRVINTDLKGAPSLVLLSLADPGWPTSRWDDGAGNVWRHVTYTSLAEVLAAVAHPQDTDYFPLATLTGWMTTVDRLGRLSELVCQPGPAEPVLLPQELSSRLAEIRLDAPVQKLRAHHVATELRRLLGDPLPEDVSVSASLTNGLGLVEAFVRVGDNIEAGWQLQGTQWRMAVRVGKDHPLYGRGDKDDPRARLADQSGWMTFRDGPFEGLPARPVPRVGTPDVCKFSPNFVYRYVHVPDITIGTAVSVGLDVVLRALSERGEPRWRSPR
ncbi:MAG: hypothetical protein ACRDTX_18115 [Pseudonocardiaceae bacterium]